MAGSERAESAGSWQGAVGAVRRDKRAARLRPCRRVNSGNGEAKGRTVEGPGRTRANIQLFSITCHCWFGLNSLLGGLNNTKHESMTYLCIVRV